MDTEAEIAQADRPQLEKYLESWGYECYEDESDEQLRTAALGNFQTEGPGNGPMDPCRPVPGP